MKECESLDVLCVNPSFCNKTVWCASQVVLVPDLWPNEINICPIVSGLIMLDYVIVMKIQHCDTSITSLAM